MDGKLKIFEFDFKVLVKEWDIPEEVVDRKQIILDEDLNLKVVYAQSNTLFQIEYLANGERLTSNSLLPEGEIVYGGHDQGNQNIFIEGISESYNDQIYFRNIPIDQDIEYTKSDVEIENFTLIRREVPQDFQFQFDLSFDIRNHSCLLYTSPSPRDATLSRMPSSA